MTARDSLDTIATFWSALLGCDASLLDTPQVSVVPNRIDAGPDGILVVQPGIGCVVGVLSTDPAGLTDAVVESIGPRPPAVLLGGAFWHEAFTARAPRVSGPDVIMVADASDFQPATANHSSRLLEPADRAVLEEFVARLPEADRRASGLEPEQEPMAGVWLDGELAAVAGQDAWAGRVAPTGCATRPGRRGRGLARAAVSVLGRAALLHGCVLHARVDERNAPGLALARTLGFQPWGRVLSVGLGE